MTIWQGIATALGQAEYVNALGWVLAASMMVGAIIDGEWRRLIYWFFATATGVVFVEFARYAFWSVRELEDLSIQGSALTVIGTLVYCAGLATGWFIAYVARCRARGEKIWPMHSVGVPRSDSSKGE